MNEKVLFVDDDINILNSFKRRLRKHINLDIAISGEEAIRLFESASNPYAVIVSDQFMPNMNGIELLSIVKERWPETVRLMLTGQSDLSTAIDAVNEGNIFRFMTKPCPSDVLLKSINSALKQYDLVISEKELLEKTLHGSVKVLTEMISFISPIASGKTSRVHNYVKHIVKKLNLEDEWKYDLAAMLSQLGSITLPINILDKTLKGIKLSEDEHQLYIQHPMIAKKLLAHIPRLYSVAYMISGQLKDFSEFPEKLLGSQFAIGSQILRIAIDFDNMLITNDDKENVVKKMLRFPERYNTEIVKTLQDIDFSENNAKIRKVYVSELHTHMFFKENVIATNGIVLVRKDKEVTFTVIELLRSYNERIGVKEPILVVDYL